MADNNLKIIIEDKVPFLNGIFEEVGAGVEYLPAEAITSEKVKDADALIVRTRTRCDASLLSGSRVQIVATATIGMDHIDLQWCRESGIEVVNAPGCNAPAVAQYVFASIMELIFKPISSYTIGIIGVGNVGKTVERWARGLGMNVLLYDPPRRRAEKSSGWSTLEEIARKADIITFHTPLTFNGEDFTYHLADEDFFNGLQKAPIIINAARGGVVDEKSLLHALEIGKVRTAVIDCWENEPNISPQLLEKASIATPHIAGYSAPGKARASIAVAKAVANKFGLGEISPKISVPNPAPTVTADAVVSSYSPLFDSKNLKDASLKENPIGQTFETLRNNYQLREETPEGNED